MSSPPSNQASRAAETRPSPVQRIDSSKSCTRSGEHRAPLVSVIVAAFNAERYIGETCRSVLIQTYSALELIVVDDGSNDGTSDVVGALAAADPRVRLIRQQNLGVAAARNRAIAAARGEFIAPLDADDLWAPTKVERQLRRLQECGIETGAVYCWWSWIDSHGAVLGRSPDWRIEGRVLQRLIEINFTGNASVPMYRRSVVEGSDWYSAKLRDLGCQGCEDWDLVLRTAERYAVSVVPAVLVGYRRRTDSMSADCQTMWHSRAQVMATLAARQPSIPPAVFRRSTGQFALHLAGVAFWSGNYLQACYWGLRVRSLTLGLAILPYVARLFARRLLRAGSFRRTPAAGNNQFDESALPDPLIPYDRIYARRWRMQARAAQSEAGQTPS